MQTSRPASAQDPLQVSGQSLGADSTPAYRLARAHGSFASKLAAALVADKRSEEILEKLHRVERSAREQRHRVHKLDGKFAWINALAALAREESTLESDLHEWGRAREGDADIRVLVDAPTDGGRGPDAADADSGPGAASLPDTVSLHEAVSEQRSDAKLTAALGRDLSQLVLATTSAARAALSALGGGAAEHSVAPPSARSAQPALPILLRRAIDERQRVRALVERVWSSSQGLLLEEAGAAAEVAAAQAAAFAALSAAAPNTGSAPGSVTEQPEGGSGSGLAAALDALATAAGCTDAGLRMSMLDAAVGLQRRCDADIDTLDAVWAKQCRDWGIADASDECGGWSEDAHRAYSHALSLHAHSRRTNGATASAEALAAALEIVNAAAAASALPGTDAGSSAGPGRSPSPRKAGKSALLPHSPSSSGSVVTPSVSGGEDAGETPAATAAPSAPQITIDQLRTHHTWFIARKHALSKRAARLAQWRRERDALLVDAKAKFAASATAAAEAAARASAAAEQERRSHELHVRLEREREHAALEAAVEAQVALDLAAAEAVASAVQAAAWRERALVQKRALEAYRRENALVAEGRARVAAATAAIAAEAAAEARSHHSERVEFRARLLEERRARQAALAAQTAELDAQQAALVARLAECVPYRDRLDEIAAAPPDPERIAAPTESSRAAADLSQAYAAFLQQAQAPLQHAPPRPPLLPPSARSLQAGLAPGTGRSGGGGSIGGGAGGTARSSEAASTVFSAAGGGGTSHGAVDLFSAAIAANKEAGGGLPRHPVPPPASAAGSSRGRGSYGGAAARSSSAASRRRSGSGGGEASGGSSSGVDAAQAEVATRRDALLRLAEYRTREQGLFGRAGFSDAQVTADPRFRLNAALRAGGLGGSAYAQQMLVQAGDGLRGAVAARRQQATLGSLS